MERRVECGISKIISPIALWPQNIRPIQNIYIFCKFGVIGKLRISAFQWHQICIIHVPRIWDNFQKQGEGAPWKVEDYYSLTFWKIWDNIYGCVICDHSSKGKPKVKWVQSASYYSPPCIFWPAVYFFWTSFRVLQMVLPIRRLANGLRPWVFAAVSFSSIAIGLLLIM